LNKFLSYLIVILIVYSKTKISDNVVNIHTCHVLFNVVPFIPNIYTLFCIYVMHY